MVVHNNIVFSCYRRSFLLSIFLVLLFRLTFGAPQRIGPKAPQFEFFEPTGNETLFDDNLEPVIRPTAPGDVTNQWYLLEVSDGKYNCPATITHTTYKRVNEGQPFMLGHNTIKHNGVRCESKQLDKRLEFWRSADYDDDKQPLRNGVAPLPEGLLQMINSTGPNVNLFKSFRESGQNFMLGYEFIQRVCKNESVFREGTTAYIAHLSTDADPIRVHRVETQFYPGFIYLVMVPQYQGVTCVYSTDPEPTYSFEPSSDKSPDLENSPGSTPVEEGSIESSGSAVGTDDDADEDSSIESILPEASPTTSEGAVCFPADGVVTVSSGEVIPIEELQIGDNVAIGRGVFSQVFGFSHYDATSVSTFVVAETASGHSLRATPGHYVYVNGQIKPMRGIKKGDTLTLDDGSSTVVVQVNLKRLRGLYNPQTAHGDIVVDGVLATTFTTAVLPVFAHAALAPVRASFRLGLFGVFGRHVDCIAGVLDTCGLRGLLNYVPKGSVV